MSKLEITVNTKKKIDVSYIIYYHKVLENWKLLNNPIIGKLLNDNVVEYYIAIKILFSEIILIELEDPQVKSRK